VLEERTRTSITQSCRTHGVEIPVKFSLSGAVVSKPEELRSLKTLNAKMHTHLDPYLTEVDFHDNIHFECFGAKRWIS
jgi:hypothetical protein